MFIIANNYEIRITKGSNSGKFPLILNSGTNFDPDWYTFIESIYIGGKTPKSLNVRLDKDQFKKKCSKPGLYSFYYLYGQWYLFDDEVNLEDYGLSCSGLLENESAFSIINNGEEDSYIRFYLIPVNAPLNDWILRKTFYRTGVIISERVGQLPLRTQDLDIIDEDGNINLSISNEDTYWLDAGEYTYVVLASIKDKKTGKSEVNTVTNRLPFYLIDDNFDRRWE